MAEILYCNLTKFSHVSQKHYAAIIYFSGSFLNIPFCVTVPFNYIFQSTMKCAEIIIAADVQNADKRWFAKCGVTTSTFGVLLIPLMTFLFL
jgi:hypothetical protein